DAPPLSRRVPGAAFAAETESAPPPPDGGVHGPSLAKRSPGAHLSHKPVPPSPPRLDGEPRPRPERVHDLLARHLRCIREGRTGSTHADDRTDEPLGREDDR